MRGLKIIINGIASYVPYNRQVMALYEERNNILRGTANEQKEFATMVEASEAEVQKYLLADVVAPTHGLQFQPQAPSVDMTTLMSLFLTQQNELAELKKQMSAKSDSIDNDKLQKAAKEKTLKPAKDSKPAPINPEKKEEIEEIPVEDELQDFT